VIHGETPEKAETIKQLHMINEIQHIQTTHIHIPISDMELINHKGDTAREKTKVNSGYNSSFNHVDATTMNKKTKTPLQSRHHNT
jgi:hypothetical protein